MKNIDDQIRQQLVNMLTMEQAHMSFAKAVADFPKKLINTRPPKVDYSFWQLVEHLRITQWDIWDFCRNPDYKYMKWPDDYWPKKEGEASWEGWQKSITDFEKNLGELVEMVENPAVDLMKPFEWGDGQNLVREVIVVAQHNSYHIGELAILRQVIGAWPEKRAE